MQYPVLMHAYTVIIFGFEFSLSQPSHIMSKNKFHVKWCTSDVYIVYRTCWIITLVVILEICSSDGLLLLRGHYFYVGRYNNRERIYTNRNCRLKCSLSLRVFTVLTFFWLFHARPFFSQSSHSATVLLTSRMWTNVIVIAVSTYVCYGTASKFTPGTILVWVVTIDS